MTSFASKDGLSSTDYFCTAAMTGDLKVLEEQIQSGCNINERHEESGLLPLHFAVNGCNIKCLELLLSQKDIDVNCAATGSGETPLHMAVKCAVEMNSALFGRNKTEHTQICKQLVDNGADILALSADGNTPLQFSFSRISSASIQLAKVLLENDRLHKDDEMSAQNAASKALLEMLEETNPSFQPDEDPELDLMKLASQIEMMTELLEVHGAELILSGCGRKLASVARRIVQGKLATHVLKELETFDERTLSCYIGETLTEACNGYDNDYSQFEDFCSKLTKRTVALFNKFPPMPEGPTTYPSLCLSHPLLACFGSFYGWNNMTDAHYERLKKLLELGFDPRVPMIRRRFLFGEGSFVYGPWALLHRNLFQSDTASKNILSYFIETLEGTEDEELSLKVVKLLLEHGAHTNAQTESEISPLMTICEKYDESWEGCHTIAKIYQLLVSNGADFNYKSSTNPFKCSNVVLAAAVFGFYFIFENMRILVVEKGLNPMDVLTDLANFEYPVPTSEDSFIETRKIIFNNLVYFIFHLLEFTIKWGPVLSAFRQIHHMVLGNAEPHEFSVKVLSDIYAMFDGEVPTMQSVCRAVIRETVAGGKLCDMREKIDQLPVPPLFKKYLMFESK